MAGVAKALVSSQVDAAAKGLEGEEFIECTLCVTFISNRYLWSRQKA